MLAWFFFYLSELLAKKRVEKGELFLNYFSGWYPFLWLIPTNRPTFLCIRLFNLIQLLLLFYRSFSGDKLSEILFPLFLSKNNISKEKKEEGGYFLWKLFFFLRLWETYKLGHFFFWEKMLNGRKRCQEVYLTGGSSAKSKLMTDLLNSGVFIRKFIFLPDKLILRALFEISSDK